MCGGWARVFHWSFVITSCALKLVCGSTLSCWRRIATTFLWDWPHLKCFCKVFWVWIYRSELMVSAHGRIPTKIPSSASQKTEHVRCMSLTSTWPFSEPAVCDVWLTPYTFFNCLWAFVMDSFCATRNSRKFHGLKCTLPYYTILMIPCACMRWRTVSWHCSSSDIQINKRKNCRHFLLILSEI